MQETLKKRAIQKVWKSQPTVEGAGVHLRRAFGFHEVPQLDPFLLLDDFHSENPDDYKAGFPWHPHRGMETITYVLDGNVEHGDSMKNSGIISAGDVQWMTAGSGIIHQEMPKGDRKGEMWGFQLWANLPGKNKMMDPRYREVKAKTIPQVKTNDGALVRVIAGSLDGVQGPVREIVTDPEFLDVSVPAGKSFVHRIKPNHNVFAYIIDGEGYFDSERDSFQHEMSGENYYAVSEMPGSLLPEHERTSRTAPKAPYFDMNPSCAGKPGTLILYGAGDGIAVTSDKKPVRFLLVSGKPIREPVAWYGPIVMNAKDELRTAFEEYNAGTFIKRK